MKHPLEIDVFLDNFLTDSNLLHLLGGFLGARRNLDFVEFGLRSLNHIIAKSMFAVGCVLALSPTAAVRKLFELDSQQSSFSRIASCACCVTKSRVTCL
jgi:hypothetical protein